MIEYILSITPLVTGYGVSALCGMDETAGKDVSFRPPSWVFGVVWLIMYLLLGAAWLISHRLDPNNSFAFATLTLLLNLWIATYYCARNKSFSMYVLLESIAAVIACMYVGNITSRIMLAPLLAWILFATVLNAAETASDEE